MWKILCFLLLVVVIVILFVAVLGVGSLFKSDDSVVINYGVEDYQFGEVTVVVSGRHGFIQCKRSGKAYVRSEFLDYWTVRSIYKLSHCIVNNIGAPAQVGEPGETLYQICCNESGNFRVLRAYTGQTLESHDCGIDFVKLMRKIETNAFEYDPTSVPEGWILISEQPYQR